MRSHPFHIYMRLASSQPLAKGPFSWVRNFQQGRGGPTTAAALRIAKKQTPRLVRGLAAVQPNSPDSLSQHGHRGAISFEGTVSRLKSLIATRDDLVPYDGIFNIALLIW